MLEKVIKPQSRFIINKLFKRNYDVMQSSAQSAIDKVVLVGDVLLILGLIWL